MILVPYHSLVLLSSKKYLNKFPTHEFLDFKNIEIWLGKSCNPESLDHELIRILETRFRLGGRVVMVINDQHQKEYYARYCEEQGIKIFVGDADYKPVMEPNISDFNGVTVVGDVHGEMNKLRSAVQWAAGNKHLICFLGDIIDYGEENVETMNLVYSLIMNGKATMLMGNHERKILRWVDNKKVKLSESNMTTIKSLTKLSPQDKTRWINRFRALCANSKTIMGIDDFVFVHGAVHPSYWSETPNKKMIENYAYYGETDNSTGIFRMMYDWVNFIPLNKTVIVGHDKRSTIAPLNISTTGGKAIFLDTGCGKGGQLTSADLKLVDDKLRLTNYNKHG